jgi:hypothetical protein
VDAGGVTTNVISNDDTQAVTNPVEPGTVEGGESTEDAPMQTEPGAGAGTTQEQTVEAAPLSAPGGDQQTLVVTTYGFQLNYPAGFLITEASAEQLAQLAPTPLAGWRVLNPQTAASDVAELEPADLEIRVYAAGAPLEEWLVANTLLPADGSVSPAPFEAANITGLEVCSSTMIAPGCAYFFAAGGEYIYQLIPASLEGETMMGSLNVTQ